MSDEELIARLRSADLTTPHYERDPLHKQAADRLAAQAAEIERLEVTVKRFAERHERHLVLGAEARVRVEKAEAKAEAKLENLIGGAETVLEVWDHHMRDAVVPTALHDAVEELRADVAEAKGGKDD